MDDLIARQIKDKEPQEVSKEQFVIFEKKSY